MYREQTYVERCHCEEPAVAPCAACGRARCKRHLARKLCDRCRQFVGREQHKRSLRPWISGTVSGVLWALATMVAIGPGITIFGLPLGVAIAVGHRAVQRRVLIKQMGPMLSASKGELPPPPPPEEPFSTTPFGGMPPGAA